jgi:2-dehydro-3-deoxygalactonokinase
VSVANHVAGDWGTSHLRLSLCDARGVPIDSRNGPGVAQVRGNFAEIYEKLLEPWTSRYGALPSILCGMVGSSIGWLQTPYIACPAVAEKIIQGCVSLCAGQVHILPGVSCENRLQAPDFMRGEETQIMGAITLDATLRAGRHVLCLPGTHTKWVALEEGAIKDFLTAPTGELFDVLRNHSVLVRDDSDDEGILDNAAFTAALTRFSDYPQAQILHRLFECRSRLLNGELAAPDAAAYLSGLLISFDVGGALQLFAEIIAQRNVYVIGAPRLTRLYAAALAVQSCGTRQVDGHHASLAGLSRAQRQLAAQAEIHAV